MNRKKWLGLLRCRTCGCEAARVPKGFNYGFPKCCGQVMTVVTEAQLREEREFGERMEEEEAFLRAALNG